MDFNKKQESSVRQLTRAQAAPQKWYNKRIKGNHYGKRRETDQAKNYDDRREHFSRYRYAGTNLEAIGKEAGMTRDPLYYYVKKGIGFRQHQNL